MSIVHSIESDPHSRLINGYVNKLLDEVSPDLKYGAKPKVVIASKA